MRAEMAPSASPSVLRKLLEDSLLRHFNDLEPRLDAALEEAVKCAAAESRERARREIAEQLNQAARRMRQAHGLGEVASVLVDATRPFCNRAAVFRVSADIVAGERVRGLKDEAAVCRFTALRIPLSAAPAFQAVIEGSDPVVAMSTPGEFPGDFGEIMGHLGEERVALFPMAGAVLYASSPEETEPLELLAQFASAALAAEAAAVQPPAAPVSDLVAIAPVPEPRLTAEEETLHLRARRFARVQAAEIRLYHAAAVASGRAKRDLYSELKTAIDAGRETFTQKFVLATPSMVDYLHEEFVRTLANDDPGMLGPDYPGALV